MLYRLFLRSARTAAAPKARARKRPEPNSGTPSRVCEDVVDEPVVSVVCKFVLVCEVVVSVLVTDVD